VITDKELRHATGEVDAAVTGGWVVVGAGAGWIMWHGGNIGGIYSLLEPGYFDAAWESGGWGV